MTLALLSAAFLQGLAGSVHCLGMCGPFALMLGGPGERRPLLILLYNVGRSFAYAAMGLTLGSLGAMANRVVAGPAAAFVGGLFIILFGISYLFPGSPWASAISTPPQFLRRIQSRFLSLSRYNGLFAFLFGVSTAFLPCGMLYAALGLATASGRPWTGALAMFVFSLGTYPALFIAGGASRFLANVNRRSFRIVMATIMISMGLFIIGRRLGSDGSHGSHGIHGSHGTNGSHEMHRAPGQAP